MNKTLVTTAVLLSGWVLPGAAGAPGDESTLQPVDAPAVVDAGISAAVETPASAPPTSDSAGETARPGSFEINYDLKYAAFGGGITLRLLPGDQPDEFVITASTNPRGLTRVVAKPSTERSVFSFRDGNVVPLSYELVDGGDSGKNDSRVEFDWESGTAASVYEGEAAALELRDDVYDRISSDIVAILDLRNGRHPRNHGIAEKNKVRDYEFSYQGEETITLPSGEYAAVKYLRQRVGSSRSVMIWYVPEAGFLPLRIEQLKRGKTQVRTFAESFTLNPQVGDDP